MFLLKIISADSGEFPN